MLRPEGVRVRAGEARRGEGLEAVADSVPVGVRVARVDSQSRLVEVRDPVVVVVLVLDEASVGVVVVVGQLVGEAVAVGVLEDLEPEDGLDRRPVGLVRPDGELGPGHDLGGRSVDHPPAGAHADPRGEVGLHLVGRALGGTLGLDALHPRVPDSEDRPLGGLAEGAAIWPRLACRGDGVRTVADPVEVGVGVQGVGAGVGPVDVDAGARLARVLEAVSVVVSVLDEGRDGRRGPVDRVRHAVAVGVRVRGRVGREGVRACLADAGHSLHPVARAVTVVVLVLDEAGGGGVARVVIAGQLVRQAVAVAVL